MAIRTCFFDMGNVLVHFSHEKMCRNIAELCGWSVDATRRFLIDEGRQARMECGVTSELEFHQQVCEATGRHVRIEELLHAAADIFQLNESIVPVIHELRRTGHRLVLLSNTSLTHLRFIEQHFDILSLMDARVTSFEVGAMKPDNRIYEAALAAAECAPDECFYTDDIEDYIRRAETFGIRSRVYTTTAALRASLREFKCLETE